jgi:predicted Zn-dependent protease
VKRLATAVLGLLACSAAGAEPYDSEGGGPSELLFRAMGDELKRTVESLRMEDLAKPYFVSYSVLESHTLELQGSFGALEAPREIRTRRLEVALRAGSRKFDDSHFVGGRERYRSLTALLPVEDDYDALRGEIWTLTDRAYKAALQRLARKTVYRETNNIRDEIPDLAQDPVETSRETVASAPFDRAAWEERVRQISAVFRRFPDVQSSSVDLTWRAQHVYLVDSEGRSFVKPVHAFEIRLRGKAQAEDGMVQSGERELWWASLSEVPPVEDLSAAAARLAEDLTALARAPQVETYLGPVLLEGQAAGEFFNQLLASGLSNPRKIWVEREWAEQYYESGALTGRLGLRVIAPLFDIVDDPTRTRFEDQPLIGHYRVDSQGIPARRVKLVERGILKDLLMSRSPTQERKLSNGHARGGFSAPAAAGIGNLFVTPSTTTSLAKMKRRLRSEAQAFGLDHGILIRRITQESDQENDELLSAPAQVFEVDVASGEERLVRDAQFQSVTLRALRDILAASDRQHVYNLAKQGPFRSSSAFRASIVHPSVLLSEMELTRTERKPSRLPYLSHPAFDSASDSD